MISGKNYTFYIASTPGKLKKLIVPAYVLHGLAALAIIGSITVVAAVGSYSRMLWKVGNYNAVRHDRKIWKKQYRELQTTVKDTNQRLDSVQSLATDVAMTYGVMQYHPAAFETSDTPSTPQDLFDRSVEQYTFLKRNAAVIAVSAEGLRMMPSMAFADSNYTPSIWPVVGHITDGFGERLDPFSGEGAFHTGVDVGADYGAPVHVTADGIVWTPDSTPVTAASSSSITVLASPPGTPIFPPMPLSLVPASSAAKSSATPESAAAQRALTSITKFA